MVSRRSTVLTRLSAHDAEELATTAVRLARTSRAFANPVRAKILLFLWRYTAVDVSELAVFTGASVPTVSRYVAMLRDAGWLCTQAHGRYVRVWIHPARMEALRFLHEWSRSLID